MPETAFSKVKLARSNQRPTAGDYLSHILSDFIELHGDRRFADDPAIIAGLAYLGDLPITVAAIEKGRETEERVKRNFGAPSPEGYRKALRLFKQAEKFQRPILCLVDTSGAYCGIEAENRGQGQAIAENLREMMALKTPIISLFIGEGGSGGALALAVADEVWMLENAIYSVISPEGCASILWKDAARSAEAAQSLKLTAQDAQHWGIIERIIGEENLGQEAFFAELKGELLQKFGELKKLAPETLPELRYQRFRKLGTQNLIENVN